MATCNCTGPRGACACCIKAQSADIYFFQKKLIESYKPVTVVPPTLAYRPLHGGYPG